MKPFVLASVCLAAVGMFGLANVAQATYDFVVTPADLADGAAFDNGHGTEMFGYDADGPKPIGVVGEHAPGFGEGSFWSDVQGSAAGGGRDYTAFRIAPRNIFGKEVTIAELDEITYWTKNANTDLIDWQVKIYTEGDGTSAHWYGHRFNLNRGDADDNDWHAWSGINLGISDVHDKYANAYVTGVPTEDSWQWMWDNYGTETVMFIDIIAGYATDSPPVDAYLDGVGLTVGDIGELATMDLEPVPEPATLLVWSMLGALGAVAYCWRKK